MATALQQQLAQISANSTHQLDLKAQKTRHAKSLLFDPRDASRQSFDDIYYICIEGFDELCHLDSRCTPFANNLFSEGSKGIDRGQLTQQENDELDGLIQSFLGLVQGRLLLNPAQKSVEWLVRRYQVHEYSTETLLLTFLPYHSSEKIFPALLAILPTDRQLPSNFKWLHPYMASFSCPPRHAVLSSAVSNRGFFATLNSFVLRIAKAGHASGLLLGFWAGILAQGVNGMLDASRSGRDDVRRQREEQTLLSVLPTLQEAFTVGKKARLDEMFVGACMCVMILATKASLSDAVLDATMEAVASAWTESTINEGLTCLAVVAEEKSTISLPATVTRNIVSANALPILVQQAKSQRVSKLAAGIAAGIVHLATMKDDTAQLHLVREIFEAGILQESDVLAAMKILVSECAKKDEGTIRSSLLELVSSLLSSDRCSQLAQRAVRNTDLDSQGVGSSEFIDVAGKADPLPAIDMEVDPLPFDEGNTAPEDFQETLDSLPTLPAESFSFFSPGVVTTDIFKAYSTVFHTALESESFMESFLNLDALNRAQSMSTPNFLSFLARLWSSGSPSITTAAKFRALTVTVHELKKDVKVETSGEKAENDFMDLQYLIPYLLTALSDDKIRIRQTAVEVCRALGNMYATFKGQRTDKTQQIWSQNSLYGSNTAPPAGDIAWPSANDAGAFFTDIIVPALEDCALDSGYIIRYLAEVLERGSSSNSVKHKKSKGLSKYHDAAVCNLLASHARFTPVLGTKICLLQILGNVDKNASVACEQILLPFVKEWAALSSKDVRDWCDAEGVIPRAMDVSVLANLKRRSDEQLKWLREICSNSHRTELMELAFERQRQIWLSLKKFDQKVTVVDWLIQIITGRGGKSEVVQEQALETLSALELSTEIAVHLLESLPTVSDLETQPPSTKRQRRLETERTRVVDPEKVELAIRKITLVLELLEASKQHEVELLKPLFHLLAELRQFKNTMDTELVYLHAILLDVLLSVISEVKPASSNASNLDRAAIRTDLLIDCVRSTASQQIHNTALLIVSALATLAPESVLHSVIPLFTFMSSTVLRKNDEYSAHVTDQAVTRIVPALANSLKKGKQLLGGVSELLLSFVAAWEHVPLHRRLGLFETLVRAVGVEECLGLVAAILLERYSDTGSSVSKFVVDLMDCFDSLTVLKAAIQWLRLISDGLSSKPKSSRRMESLSDSLLGFSEKTEDEKIESVETLIEGLAVLLQRDMVRNRISATLTTGSDDEALSIRSQHAVLTEQIIQMAQRVAASHPTLRGTADTLLSSSLGLLPTTDFIASCAQLMQTGSASTRQHVFYSLESRVHTSKAGNALQRQTFLDVLPSCAVFVSEDQPVEVRMAAIGCIDGICEKFGKSDRESVRNAAEKIAGPAALGFSHLKLRVLSLLCLASMVGVLGDGDEGISIFPKAVSRTLDHVESIIMNAVINDENGSKTDDSSGLQDAGFRFLTAVLDNISWILASAPSELDRALSLAAKAGEKDGAVAEFRYLCTKQVPATELLKGIERTWLNEVKRFEAHEDVSPVPFMRTSSNLLDMLQQCVQYHTKASVAKNAATIFNVLLLAFGLRRHFLEKVDDPYHSSHEFVHEKVDQVALDATRKLNDATFRPFFVRLVEWATSSLPAADLVGRRERQLSLFSFALVLFEQLKSLVTSYASFLLETVVELLVGALTERTDNGLLQLVVQTLASSFRNDEEDFWIAPAHFNAVAGPLINLLKVTGFESHLDAELVISTVADLAMAVSTSPEQLKALNTILLSLLRHESANVRLMAVESERAITKSVNVEWLAMLPELLPVISELQEDDDERVENQTLVWVREIEDISGESLEGMLA